jgi:hypothetical protein
MSDDRVGIYFILLGMLGQSRIMESGGKKITLVRRSSLKNPHSEVKSIRLDVDGALPAGSTE